MLVDEEEEEEEEEEDAEEVKRCKVASALSARPWYCDSRVPSRSSTPK